MALPRLCGANTFATSLGQDPGNPQSLPGSCYKRTARPPNSEARPLKQQGLTKGASRNPHHCPHPPARSMPAEGF